MDEIKSNNTFLNKITEDEIKNMPKNQFAGNIHLIGHPKEFDILEKKLVGLDVLGFDTETRPSFKKGRTHKVALLQLATASDAFLIRLNKVGLPKTIVQIFENERIKKIGVAIRDDLKSLKKIRNFESNGFIDLQNYVKDFNILDMGLKKLTANILGFRISKRQQTSNWENEVLSEDQQIYAATDAWVCYKIYQTLINHSNG